MAILIRGTRCNLARAKVLDLIGAGTQKLPDHVKSKILVDLFAT
jgi:hypothetical protein